MLQMLETLVISQCSNANLNTFLYTAVDLRNWLLNFCEISIQSNVKPIKKSIRRECKAAKQIDVEGYCVNRPCNNALSTANYIYTNVRSVEL